MDGSISGITRNKIKVGDIYYNYEGLRMTVVSVNGRTVIVEFDDGVKRKCNNENIRYGNVRHSNKIKLNIGDIFYNNKGLRMKIIDVLDNRSIVIFDDGIKKECSNSSILNGSVSHPSESRKFVKVGDIFYTNAGLRVRVIEVNGQRSVIVFDDGSKRECTNSALKKGCVAHPSKVKKKNASDFIGMTSRHTSGELMTIEEYFGTNNITVRFEDGTIVYNKHLNSFKSGEVAKEKIDYESKRVGESVRHSNGMLMTIIAYRSCIDIDIMFEDGTIVRHKRYKSFKEREIRYPFEHKLRDKTGEKRYNNSGLGMTVKCYRTRHDIDVICDDGTELNGVSYSTFLSGNLGHKGLRSFKGKIKDGNLFSSFQVKEVAYRLKRPEDVYYICECTKCKLRDILTPTEMINHSKSCRG